MKKAVILFNLGGPDKLESVEPFLFNLFNDPAIISIPSFIRYPLAKFISKRRTPIAKNIYREIGNKSPILELTEQQANSLEKNLLKKGNYKCFIVMRCWRPRASEVIKKVKQAKINSYFLLDVEYPFIFKSIKKKQRNIAIRFSEIEPISNAKILHKYFNWIWIDTITKLPVDKDNLKIIKKYNSCLVCPERWGRSKEIKSYWKKLIKLKFIPNAVMTSEKYANRWGDLFNLYK